MNGEKEPAAASGQNQIEEELSKAFHLLCDPFPEPVALCHRTIAWSPSTRPQRNMDGPWDRIAQRAVLR